MTCWFLILSLLSKGNVWLKIEGIFVMVDVDVEFADQSSSVMLFPSGINVGFPKLYHFAHSLGIVVTKLFDMSKTCNLGKRIATNIQRYKVLIVFE